MMRLIYIGRSLVVANIGDSRCILIKTRKPNDPDNNPSSSSSSSSSDLTASSVSDDNSRACRGAGQSQQPPHDQHNSSEHSLSYDVVQVTTDHSPDNPIGAICPLLQSSPGLCVLGFLKGGLSRFIILITFE